MTKNLLRGGDALRLVLFLTLLLMALQGNLGAAQSLADFFRCVGCGRILQVLMHFAQVLMLLFNC